MILSNSWPHLAFCPSYISTLNSKWKTFDQAMAEVRDEEPALYQQCSKHMAQSADHVHELLNM
jgi:hypothetical protein